MFHTRAYLVYSTSLCPYINVHHWKSSVSNRHHHYTLKTLVFHKCSQLNGHEFEKYNGNKTIVC